MNILDHEVQPVFELFSFLGKDYVLAKINDKTFNSVFYVGVEFGKPCGNIWNQQFLILDGYKGVVRDDKNNPIVTTLYKALNIAHNGFEPSVIKTVLGKPNATKMERKFLANSNTVNSGSIDESVPPSSDILVNHLQIALNTYDSYDVLS